MDSAFKIKLQQIIGSNARLSIVTDSVGSVKVTVKRKLKQLPKTQMVEKVLTEANPWFDGDVLNTLKFQDAYVFTVPSLLIQQSVGVDYRG